MKTVSLRLADAMDRELSEIAREQATSRSELVRMALETYLANKHAKRKGSCLDLASDLIGSVEGPSDLSTNKEYLKGYGR